MPKIAKRIAKNSQGMEPGKAYALAEAVKLVKERANAKFDETVEVAMNLGVDPRHADQMVSGVCSLPNGSGRKLRVAVFAKGAKAEEAKKAGADIVGAEDLVETVSKGTIEFDRCIATPDLMPLVGRLGKVLGPRGLMPNPKVGTVTMDVSDGGERGQGRFGRVPRRKGGHHSGRRGQGEFHRGAADRQHQGVRRCGDEAEAAGPEGHVREEGFGVLEPGPGSEDRFGKRHRLICEFPLRGHASRVAVRDGNTCPRLQARGKSVLA